MQASQFATLADHVRNLPESGAARDRGLHRLTDLYASTEAAAALQSAARRTGGSPALAPVLARATSIFGDGVEDLRLMTDHFAAREQLRDAVTAPEFLSLVPALVLEMRELASTRPETGACTLGTALEMWHWTVEYFSRGEGASSDSAIRAVDELAEILCPLLAARCLAVEVATDAVAGTPAEKALRANLCHVMSARAAAATSAACAELVFGYRKHLVWDAEGCATCFAGEALDDLEAIIPGMASGVRARGDVIEADGTHPVKAGPCARFDGLEGFVRLRNRLDGCLTGARLAKDSAANALERSMASLSASEGNS